MNNSYSKLEKNMYLIGVLGQSMIYEIIRTGFYYYLQNIIFIPAIIIGLLTTITKILDALKNPIMGSIVDRTKTKWGKCRPYLLFTPSIICILTMFCFFNGTYNSNNNFSLNFYIVFFATFIYLMWGIVFTATDVPLWSLISLITEDENDRSNLMISARNISNIGCGIVAFSIVYISQILGKVITERINDNTKGLKYGVIIIAISLTLVSSIMFQMAGLFTKERIKTNHCKKKNLKENILVMWNCKPFKQLLISGLLRSPVSLMRKIQLTLLTYYYGDNGNTPYIHIFILLGGGYMIAQFVAIAITPHITKKISKDIFFYKTNVYSIVPYLSLFAVYAVAHDKLDKGIWFILVFIIFILIGASAGFINALQSLMIADIVDYEEYKNGYRPDGVFYSLQPFLSNFSNGIASLLSGIIFSIVGFSGDGVRLINDALYDGASFKSDSVFSLCRLSMFVMCSILPAIGLAISLIPLKKYNLSDSKHKLIMEKLKKTRN